jgi:acetoacetyl-CoA reductase
MNNNNKTVFITGGSRGIGRAIVNKFSENGFNVLFTYNESKTLAMELESNTVKAFQCNSENLDEIMELEKKLKIKDYRVDILINNAGITSDRTFKNLKNEDWEKVINIDLNSAFYFCKIFFNWMIDNKWGRIINISSIIGQKGGFGQANYSAAKAGLIGLTKTIALETAKKGITVNAIAPGFVDTDMFRDISKDIKDKIISDIPLKRLGKPVEIASLCYFLASESASYITGQVIGINGGLYM